MVQSNEKIFQELFKSKGLSKRQRDFYLNVIRNSKEMNDSIVDPTDFSLFNASLLSKNVFGTKVVFSAVLTSEEGERFISGIISVFGKTIKLVDVDVMRIGMPIESDDFIYTFNETFEAKENVYERTTTYSNSDTITKTYIPFFNEAEMEAFKGTQINRIKKMYKENV